MVHVFDGAVVNGFKRSEFVCFWSVSTESVKELIYQKKNGVTRQLRGAISMCNASLHEWEHYISHDMFDMLVFLLVLCASTKKKCIRDTVS